MFLFVGLALSSSVFAKVDDPSKTFGESQLDNFWTIYEQKHYDCFSSTCVIYPRVCNDKNQQRTMNMSVFADIEPLVIEQWQNMSNAYQNIATGQSCQDINGSSVCYSTYSSAYDYRYGAIVSALGSGIAQGKKFKKSSTTEVFFDNNECTDFRVTLKNILGAQTKFDVWFLDPIINSSFYRGVPDLDLNSTQTNMSRTSRTMSIGMFYNITEAWGSGKRTNIWINKTNLFYFTLSLYNKHIIIA